MKTLICTLGMSYAPILTAIRDFGCDKLIILYEAPKEQCQRTLDMITEAIPKILMPSEFIELQQRTLSVITRRIRSCIITEFKGGNEIYVNVSGGSNTLIFAAQQACYIEYDKVSRLFYISEEQGQVIELPVIHWRLSDSKRYILGFLFEKKFMMHDIATFLLLSSNMVYKHINQLVEDGFLEKKGEKFVLTPLGELMADADIFHRLEWAFMIAKSISELDRGKGVTLKRITKYLDRDMLNAGVSSFNAAEDWVPAPDEDETLEKIRDAVVLNYVEEIVPDPLLDWEPSPQRWRLKITTEQLNYLEECYEGPLCTF